MWKDPQVYLILSFNRGKYCTVSFPHGIVDCMVGRELVFQKTEVTVLFNSVRLNDNGASLLAVTLNLRVSRSSQSMRRGE